MVMTAKNIDVELYKAIFKLVSSRPWLEERDEQVIELLNECETYRQQNLILGLLERFKFSNSSDLGASAKALAHKITSDWALTPDATAVVAVADKYESDGSHFLLKAMAQKFSREDGWGNDNFFGYITSIAELSENYKNIVLVDDFIGTGKKISRKIKWVREILGERSSSNAIYVCSMASMNLSIRRLDDLGINYFSTIWLPKGISDFYIGDQLAEAIEDMAVLERNLSELNNDYRFGYKKSEALYYHEPYNVSNNVFPLFWWEKSQRTKYRKVLFSRGAA
jgi:hypothetical protein